MILAGLLVALAGCEPSGEVAPSGREAAPSPSGEAGRATAESLEARAARCIDEKDWECAASNLRAASAAASQPLTATRERLATALEREARSREKLLSRARPGLDRLVAAQDAAAAWTLWSEVSGKPQPASAVRVSKIAAREEAAAARRHQRRAQPQGRSLAPARECCVHCATGCPCGDSCISCSKTCRKGPGCAC